MGVVRFGGGSFAEEADVRGTWKRDSATANGARNKSSRGFLNQVNRRQGAATLDPRRVFSDAVRLSDFFVCTLAGAGGEFLYHLLFLQVHGDLPGGLALGALAGMIIVMIGSNAGSYAFDKLLSADFQIRRLGRSCLITSSIFLTAAFLFKSSDEFSRGAILSTLVLGVSGLIIVRTGLYFLAQALLKGGGVLKSRLVIVGATPLASQLLEKCAPLSSDISVIGLFDDRFEQGPDRRSFDETGSLDDLLTLIGTTRVDEIVIALPWSAAERIEEVMDRLSVVPVPIKLCPEWLPLEKVGATMTDISGIPMLAVKSRSIDGWRGIAKSTMDKTLAAALLAVLSPVFLLIMLAIKLDSKGPVIFKQDRHGFNHDIFSVLKFRTMVHGDQSDGTVPQATRNDARVTRVGKFLRKTSLDELPQLLNVLTGSMSLVGPRPHATAHNREHTGSVDRYAQRHNVKPGITGWAQVNGLRGETQGTDRMRQRVEHDLYYIVNWSLLFDLRILIQTPFVVWTQGNVY